MKKLLLATAVAFFPGLAWAQCIPTTAPPQSFGCAPQLAPQLTDYAVIWRPSLAPNGNIMISTLTQLQSLIGGGGGGGGGGPFLPLSGGTLTGLLTASAGIKTGDNINITLSSDGLAQFGYAATAGAVQLQNKPFQPLMGLQLLDNTPIVMSTDGTAIFSYDPNVGVYRFQGRPVEIDGGLTIPGGGAFAAGSVAASNGIVSGNPTGGNQGPGTVNVDTGYYVNGVLITAGAGNVNSGTVNSLGYYAASGSAISPLATAINGALVTDNSGVPSISTTLPSGLTIPAPNISGTLNLGSVNVTGALNATGSAFMNSLTLGQSLTAAGVNGAWINAASGNIVLSGAQPAFTSPAFAYNYVGNANLSGSVSSGSVNGSVFVINDDTVNMTATGGSGSTTWVNVFGNVGTTAWVPSTGYVFSQHINNNGLIYICTQAGTSASSGGPTGTGTGITDGGATWNYVSPDFSGSRAAIQGQLNILSENDPATPNDGYRNWQAALFTVTIHSNQGGTATTGGNTRGVIFASGDQSFAFAGATDLTGVIGHEADAGIKTGASAIQRAGYTAISFGDLNAAYSDAAFSIGAISGAPGWLNGLQVSGGDVYPIASTGCLLCYLPPVPGNLAGGGLTYANPVSAEVLDLAGMEASVSVVRTNGGTNINNSGGMRVQSLAISSTGSTASLDPIGHILTGVAVSSGGTAYKVNDHVYDPVTGTVLNVSSVSSGVITGFSSLGTSGSVAGSYGSVVPSSPIALLGGTGFGATFTPTWTAATSLSLAPTGGNVLVAGVGAIGAASTNFYMHANTTGQLQFGNSTDGNSLYVSDPGGAAVDFFNVIGGLTTSNLVTLSAGGTDTNVGINLTAKAAGAINFNTTGPITLGSSAAAATAVAGDLTVNGNVHFQTTGVHFFFGTIAAGANHLPTCNSGTNGAVTIIIDWNTPPLLGDPISSQAGGGSDRSLGLCDGTNWIAV